ncbi:MAG TPA: helix-turn-helix domain-containing protein [Chloroflexota bacterium]|nr:helix-turn-helix domain-containing protein [Chloroflexota bacterium]
MTQASSSGGEQMAGIQATKLELTATERQALTRLAEARRTAQQVALRANIVLLAAEGLTNVAVGRLAGVSREAVRLWRDRWVGLQAVPLADRGVAARLADAPRPGAPARIGAEQVCAIIALACEAPEQAGRPISQWTGREIADEITRRGIVETLSTRHAARLLKRGISSRT